MMTRNEIVIKAMQKRYATKAFDPARRVSEHDLDTILESIRLSPSSFGLQPWKFFAVQSQAIRKQFGDSVPANRPKFENASHVIIFTRLNTISQHYIDEYFDLVKAVRNQTDESIKMFYDMVSDKAASMSKETLNSWTSRQVYIALGSAVMSAALLGVDSCPMEGIDPPIFDEILGIDGSEYTSTVGLALGYRSSKDSFANFSRVRFPKSKIIQTLR